MSVCLSVRPSVACLDLIWRTERPYEAQNWQDGWKPVIRVTREPIYRSKGEASNVKYQKIVLWKLNGTYKVDREP